MEDLNNIDQGGFFKIKGYKKEFKILLLSAVPLILNNLSQIFLPITSLFFVGHLGPNELAAVTLAGTVCSNICFIKHKFVSLYFIAF